MKIIKIYNPEKLSLQILKEEEVLIDYINWDSIQTFDDFKSSHNINYSSNDFCLTANNDVIDLIRDKGIVSIYEFESFGWYDKKVNYSKWTTFDLEGMSNPDLEQKNSSFNQYKTSVRQSHIIDSIKGGLLMSSKYYNSDFESFINKIDFNKPSENDGKFFSDRWYVNLSQLSQKELQVCNQLLFISNYKDISNVGYSNNKKTRELLEDLIEHDNDTIKDAFICFNQIIELSLEYLILNPVFEKNEFLKYLVKNKNLVFSKRYKDQIEILYEGIKEQKDIEKVTYQPLKSLKLILLLSDSELSDITADLKELKRVELFLLGIIKRGVNIESYFESQSTHMQIFTILSHFLLDIQPRAQQSDLLRITLDSVALKRNPGFIFDKLNTTIFLLESIKSEKLVVEDLGKTLLSIDNKRKELNEEILKNKQKLDSVKKESKLIIKNIQKTKIQIKEYERNLDMNKNILKSKEKELDSIVKDISDSNEILDTNKKTKSKKVNYRINESKKVKSEADRSNKDQKIENNKIPFDD